LPSNHPLLLVLREPDFQHRRSVALADAQTQLTQLRKASEGLGVLQALPTVTDGLTRIERQFIRDTVAASLGSMVGRGADLAAQLALVQAREIATEMRVILLEEMDCAAVAACVSAQTLIPDVIDAHGEDAEKALRALRTCQQEHGRSHVTELRRAILALQTSGGALDSSYPMDALALPLPPSIAEEFHRSSAYRTAVGLASERTVPIDADRVQTAFDRVAAALQSQLERIEAQLRDAEGESDRSALQIKREMVKANLRRVLAGAVELSSERK
jgi:hypothetical protein